MLFQTLDTKIQRDILTKDLDMEAAIKTGWLCSRVNKNNKASIAGQKLDDDVCKLDDEVPALNV